MSLREREPGPNWFVVGKSIRGAGHEALGTECQDALKWSDPTGESIVLAVADGAGSAPRSRIGAEVAVEAVISALETSVDKARAPRDEEGWTALLRGAALRAHDAVLARAAKLGVPERELASTLIVVVVTPRTTAALQIGDGAIVQWRDSTPLALTRPDFGEHINETSFLTSRANVDRAQVHVYSGPPLPVAAFSDGIEMLALKMPSAEPYKRFFEPLFNLPRKAAEREDAQAELEAFLSSHGVRERTDDDVSLVMAWPRERGQAMRLGPASMGSGRSKDDAKAGAGLAPSGPPEAAAAPPPSTRNGPDKGARRPPKPSVSGSIDIHARHGAAPPRGGDGAAVTLTKLEGMSPPRRPPSFGERSGDNERTDSPRSKAGGLAFWATGFAFASVGLVVALALSEVGYLFPLVSTNVCRPDAGHYNDPCHNTRACALPLKCIGGVCRVPFKAGEPCGRDEECAAPFLCHNHNVCTRRGAGEMRVCEHDAQCGPNEICVLKHCRSGRLSPGQRCERLGDCDESSECLDQRCQPKPRGLNGSH